MNDVGAPVPNPDQDRQRFADRLEDAGVLPRRFIDVRDGEKGTRTPGHQEPLRWLEPDADELSGNYGVHPGHGLIEFDVDDYDGEHDTEALDALPETFTVESPHTADDAPGHRYYAVEDDDETKAVLKEISGTLNPEPSWGEIKYEGKYVVGPGSQLDGCTKEWCYECDDPNGGYYRIAEDHPIATLSAEDIAEVLRADPEFSDGESEQRAATEVFDLDPEDVAAEDTTANDGDEWMTEELAEKALDEIDPDLSHGEWCGVGFALVNHFGSSTGGSLFKQWSRKGRKWDKQHAESVIDDAGNYPHDIRHFVNVAKEHGWDASAAARKAVATADGGTVASSPPKPETTTNGSANDWADVMGLLDSSENGSTTRAYGRAAEALEREHSFATIRETGELYYYDPEKGYYVRKGESFIAELLEQYIPGYTNASRRRNIFDTVRARNYIDSEEFRPPEGKVCVKNGVLDLNDRELEPHSPEYYFTSRLQTPYVEGASADRWARFLEESTADNEARKIEEFIGYCLEMWHHDRHKNLIVVGPRQSGKSTFTDTVQGLFGSMPTVTNLTPQQISDTQFDAASLKEAALNAVNDINATKIQDSGTLKRVLSGERLKLERKGQDAEFGAPNAKHLFSANWLPTVVGQDESLYRRFLIVEFPNKVDDEDRDRNLKSELESELPGILWRALEARDRLHEQGGFTNDRSTSDTRRMWDSWLDAHKRFLYTQFDVTGDSADVVEKDTYYQAYKEYAGRKGYQLKPKQGVTKSLQWVPEIDVRDHDYAGIAWRTDDAADSEGDATITTPDTPQDELVRKIVKWVTEFSTPTTPAQRSDVREYAAEKGEDPERVDARIDELLERRTLWQPADEDGLRAS